MWCCSFILWICKYITYLALFLARPKSCCHGLVLSAVIVGVTVVGCRLQFFQPLLETTASISLKFGVRLPCIAVYKNCQSVLVHQ